MDLGVILFYQPIFNLIVVLYRLFGNNLGFAIIALALIFRLITFPITMRQIRMAKTNREFSDKVNDVKAKYKNNKEKQAEEMMKIQSEYLPGQLSGCLTMIIQFIMLINVFNVIRNLLTDGAAAFNEIAYPFIDTFAADKVINDDFFGVTLTQSANGIGFDNLAESWPYFALAIMVGVVQFGSTRILMGMRKKDQTEAEKKKEEEKAKKKKDKQDKGEEPESFSDILQKSTQQTTFILPLFIVFASLNFPAGLSIYWTVQSAFVIIQQFVIDRLKKNESN